MISMRSLWFQSLEKKNSDAPPSIKELPCMRTPRRDHQTSRAHNNANYTKWEEKKQLLEHWRSVCAPYLFSIAFSRSKPPAWVKRCASRRPNDEFLDTNLIYGLALTRKVISTGGEVAHPPLPFTTKQQLPPTTSLTISRFWTRLGSTHAGRWYIPLQFLFGASLPFQNWGITLMFCESNVEPLFAKFEYFIFVVLFW